MNTTYSTSSDIRDMVVEVLDASVGVTSSDFDVDGIVADIIAVADYDGRGYTVEFEDADFWEIVARHAI